VRSRVRQHLAADRAFAATADPFGATRTRGRSVRRPRARQRMVATRMLVLGTKFAPRALLEPGLPAWSSGWRRGPASQRARAREARARPTGGGRY
jgi:hypothetical protein